MNPLGENQPSQASTAESTEPIPAQPQPARRKIPQWLIDLFWPSLEPWSTDEEEKEEEKRIARLKADLDRVSQVPSDPPAMVSAALENCKELLKQEDDRRQSVDSRLTTVLGLASVAAAIIFGTAAQTLRTASDLNQIGVKLFGLVSAYIALQLLAAVFAATRGLGRRGYQVAQAEDLLPLTNETEHAYAKRQMQAYLESLSQHSKLNDAKVDQMAIAHHAIKNFVGGMLLLVLLLTALSFWPRQEKGSEERLIQRLRSDPQLIELLRGPRGSKGDQGPPGPAGLGGPGSRSPNPP